MQYLFGLMLQSNRSVVNFDSVQLHFFFFFCIALLHMFVCFLLKSETVYKRRVPEEKPLIKGPCKWHILKSESSSSNQDSNSFTSICVGLGKQMFKSLYHASPDMGIGRGSADFCWKKKMSAPPPPPPPPPK